MTTEDPTTESCHERHPLNVTSGNQGMPARSPAWGTKRHPLFAALLLAVLAMAPLTALGSPLSATKQTDPGQMIKMLDQLDKMDFEEAATDAERFIRDGELIKADNALAKAATFAHDGTDYDRIKTIRQNLVAKTHFEEAINEARIHILAREFSQAKTQLAKAPANARSGEDQATLAKVRQELAAEIRQQEREEREQRKYEIEQKRLAREEREAARDQGMTEERNEWVDTATQMIRQTADEVSRIQRQNHELAMNRIAAENRRKQAEKAKIERQRLAQENTRRQNELESQRQERLKAQRLAMEKRERSQAAMRRLTAASAPTPTAPPQSSTVTPPRPSGPKGIAILWQKKNGQWYGDGPTQRTITGEKEKSTTLNRVSGSPTTFLTTLTIAIDNDSWRCEVYRVDKEVDTSWKTSWTRNIRFRYPELEQLKPMGLD